MKMRISVKIVLWLWGLLLVSSGMLSYYAYQKFHPEVFLAMLQQQVQRNYPGSSLEVGKRDHHIALDFNVGLKDIILRRGDKVLGRLGEIELKIPWWVLLFERGNAQVNLRGLEIYVDEVTPASKNLPTQSTQKEVSLKVPEYLLKTKFTLRAKDVSVKDLKSLRRYVTISKLLVREFRYGKNSAFELNIPVEINHRGTSHTSELWLFGDITPTHESWAMNYRGELRSKESRESLAIEDVIIEGKSKFLPHRLDTYTDLVLTLDKVQIGVGKLEANEGEVSAEINFTQFPLSIFSIFENEFMNPYFPGLTGNADGSLEINKKLNKGVLRVNGALTFGGDFFLGGQSFIKGQWRIGLEDRRLETSFISSQSEVSFFRRSFLGEERDHHDQYVEELGFSGVDFINTASAILPLSQLIASEPKSYFSSTVSFKNCSWGEKAVNGVFKYGVAPEQKFYRANLESPDGKFELNYQLAAANRKLDVMAENFAWSEGLKFLAPYFSGTASKIDGNLNGRWKENWQHGKWKTDLSFGGLTSAAGSFVDLTRSFWKVYGISAEAIPDQKLTGQIKSKIIKIDSLMLEGPDPAKISGQVDVTQKSKSYLVLNYPENRKWKPVRKDISEPFWKKE